MTTTASSPDSGLRVRRAKQADLLSVYRIEQSSFPQPWPFGAFEQYAGRPGFLVAEDGAIVGYVVADTTSPAHGRPMGHVKDLAVRENRRNEGVGSLLLARAVSVLCGRVDEVKLEVRESNDPAISLYRSHGFEYRETVPEYYGNGESALVLVRTL